MNPTFRVEAFIVPISNRENKNNDNIIDDVKVANKMKDVIQSPKTIEWMNVAENNEIKKDNCTSEYVQLCHINSNDCLPMIMIDHFASAGSDEEHQQEEEQSGETEEVTILKEESKTNIGLSTVIEEPIYDVPYALLNVNKWESAKLRERFETDEYVTMKIIPKKNVKLGKAMMRTSSLISIDERGETPDDCNDEFCCHGYKNGCTVTTQRPEAVTEEIFEINWMKRLEQLRAKESIIRDKEAVLFDRERLLFRKERELRILERLIKDKLKHVELYVKRCKSKNNDAIDCDVVSKISEQSKDSQSSKDNGTLERLNSIENLDCYQKIGSDVVNNKKISGALISQEASKSNVSLNTRVSAASERILKNPPNSRSSLLTSAGNQHQAPRSDTASSYLTSRNAFGGMSGYSSLRIKKRPKITYDDLDSTLSADIGDSSFVVTSKKFDPEIFKRPNAFTRSCSERRRSRILPERPSTVAVDVAVHPIEEDKLLKRMSENILVSHDKNTKFQHYGLIDTGTNQQCEANSDSDNNRRHSYLDLEDGKKSKRNPFRSNNKKINSKERPISWNEETNEWLQKKRQAYNLQTAKKILTGDIYNNKENHDSQFKLNQMQKKVSKGMKFNIFR